MPTTTHHTPSIQAVYAGQAVYTATTLKLYDMVVLGLSNYLLWRCPTHQLLQFYRQNMRAEHLELGVGSAFYPCHTKQPDPKRLVLVDLNVQTLRFGESRIGRLVRSYQRNVLEPLDLPEHPFDSIALNYLLHCVPGDMAEKAIVFDHAKAYLKHGGIVFGSTIVQQGVPNGTAKALMRFYQRQGVFHNQADSLATLRAELSMRFHCFDVQVYGCVAVFWAIKTADDLM